MGKAVAAFPPEPPPRPHYSIAPTERGWLLVIQDDECSVMQVFRTSAAARCAVDRMMSFFDTMRAQSPASREYAAY
jgi:flagellar motor protein MotB